MVIALAGRRVDASDAAQKRFPAENASAVKQQIRDFLQSHDARALVCAAACGADILGLGASDTTESSPKSEARATWLSLRTIRMMDKPT